MKKFAVSQSNANELFIVDRNCGSRALCQRQVNLQPMQEFCKRGKRPRISTRTREGMIELRVTKNNQRNRKALRQ